MSQRSVGARQLGYLGYSHNVNHAVLLLDDIGDRTVGLRIVSDS
ncbi:hypothetical protein [Microseira wollei]|nr:hypothetical protein [Microseira wollei]